MHFKKLLLILSALALQSCTTLSDFKKMSPESRANKACKNDATVIFYTKKHDKASNRLSVINSLLSRGYKTIQTCDTSTVYYPVINPKTNKKTIEQTLQENCSTHVIPLTEYATNTILAEKSELINSIAIAKKSIDPAIKSCLNKVVKFNAEDAYNYYNN